MALKLGDMLVQAEMINREQLDEALKYQVIYGGKLGTNLIELGYLDEDDIAKFLSNKLGTKFVPHDALTNIPPEVLHILPIDIIEKYKVIPIALSGKRLTLVMSDPTDFAAIDEISFSTGYSIVPVVTPEISLVSALERYYKIQRDVRYISVLANRDEAKKEIEVVDEEEILEEAEIIEEEERRLILEEFTIDDVSKKLAAAMDRDEIAEIIAEYAGHEFGRAALFILKGQSAVGWKAFVKDEPMDDIVNLSIPLNEPSALKTVSENKNFYLGPIPETPYNNMLIEVLGGKKPEAALLVPIMMMGKAVNILYVDGNEGELGKKAPDLQRIIGKAVMAFDILILRNKIIMT